MILDSTEAKKLPQFIYMKVYEHKIMGEIKKYSLAIQNLEYDRLSGQELEESIESLSSGLYDAMVESEIAYLKHGMKLGAELILELLK